MKNINIDDGREAITINGDPNRVIYVQASDFCKAKHKCKLVHCHK